MKKSEGKSNVGKMVDYFSFSGEDDLPDAKVNTNSVELRLNGGTIFDGKYFYIYFLTGNSRATVDNLRFV